MNLESDNPLRLSTFTEAKLADFSEERLRDEVVFFSSMSVDYGVPNPIYFLDKIQSILIEEFNGKKLIEADREKF